MEALFRKVSPDRRIALTLAASALCLLASLLPAADIDKAAAERFDKTLEGELEKQGLAKFFQTETLWIEDLICD